MAELDFEKIDLGSFGINEDDNKQSQLSANMTEAVKIDGAQHAKNVKLSADSGVPEFAVKSNPAQVEQKLKFDQINLEGMTERSPKTSKFLTDDVSNSVIAQEDVMDGLLEGIENTLTYTGRSLYAGVFSGISAPAFGALEAGVDVVRSFTTKPLRDFGILPADPLEPLANLFGELNREGQALSKSIAPEQTGTLLDAVGQGLQSVPASLAALATLNPAAALNIMGGLAFGQSAAEAKVQGLPVGQAVIKAATDAVIEVASERIPAFKLIEDLGLDQPFAKTLLNQLVAEIPGEQAATLLQDFNSWAFLPDNRDKTFLEYTEERPSAALNTLIATIVGTGVQTSIVVGVQKTVNKLTRDESNRETAGEIEQRNIDKLSADSVKSKLRERDVDTFKQFVRDADGENNTHVFIDGVQTSLYLQSKTREEIEADPALQALSNAMRESDGTDIAISVDEFMGDIAGTDSFTELREHMTMSEETISPFRQEQHKVETETYVNTLMAEAEENASEYVEAQEIFTQVRDQLVDTGTVTPANASIMAQVIPAWATAQARRSGRSVAEVYEASGLTIEGPQTGELARLEGEQVLSQTPIDSTFEVKKSRVGKEPSYRDAPDLFNTVRDDFLELLEEDADFDDVMGSLGEFTAEQQRFIKALERDDWFGFDFPSQAISAALSENLTAFEPSVGLKSALGRMVNVAFDAVPQRATITEQQGVQDEQGSRRRSTSDGEQQTNQGSAYAAATGRNDSEALAEFNRAETGESVTFVHRSEVTFDQFDDSKLGGNTGTPSSKLGHYLSAADVSNNDLYGDDVTVWQTTLNNPIVIDESTFSEFTGDKDYDQIAEMRQKFMDMGHDGILITELNWMIAFEGSQLEKVEPVDDADIDQFFLQGAVDQTETKEFKEWSGGGEVIDSEDINDHEFKANTPTIVKVFHGTTHEFSVFDALRGNLEGQFGAVNYFTSSESDATDNYEGAGPDLTNRIDQRKELLVDDLEDQFEEKGRDKVLQSLHRSIGDLTFISGRIADMDDHDAADLAADTIARSELTGGQDQTMELYVRVDNPFVIGQTDEFIELVEDVSAQVVERVAENNGITVDEVNENIDQYEDEVNEVNWELQEETPNKLVDAINTVADINDIDASELSSMVYEIGESGTTIEIENLLRSEEGFAYAEGDNGELIGNNLIAQIIEEMGFDSIVLQWAEQRFQGVDMESGTTHVHIFDSGKTNIKSVDNQGTFDSTNPDIFKQDKPDTTEARGYYDPSNSVIRLTESSDLSTFLHEFAHFMYEMEAQGDTEMNQSINSWFKRNSEEVAKEATENLNGNYSALKQGERENDNKQKVSEADVTNYLDTGRTGSTDKDNAIRRAVHEQFARGFETYLLEGKAPSIELRNAFRTFARWLGQIYQALRGDLNVTLDDEMRQVFNRLLATEEQIAAAESRARVEPMFTDAAMVGMTDEEFSDYQQRQEKVKDVQTETLRDQLIKTITRSTRKWWKDEKADLIDEELIVLNAEQVYSTAARLRHVGSTADAQESVDTVKSDIVSTEKALKKLRKENDTIGQFIAKRGGLNRESMESEGIDPDHFKTPGKAFGRPLFPKQGGFTPGGVAELLNQEGYDLDANEALELIEDMLRDEDVTYVDVDVDAEIGVLESDLDRFNSEVESLEEALSTVNIKLDLASVKEMVGQKRTNKLGKTSTHVPGKLRGMTAPGQKGVHPDEAAAFFGYSSGAEMLNDLMTAAPIKEAAEKNAQSKMIERHGDVFTDGTIEQQADEAVQNEERGKLILHELKILARGTNQRSLDRQTMKSMSQDRIGQLSFREIHPGKYRKAEIRAAQESSRMLAEGNKEGAAQAKARQVLNYYLGMAATEARNETTKIVDRMARYNKKKVREEIQKSDGGHWEQIVKILERFDFRKSATLASVDQVNQDINTWALQRMDVEGDGLVLHNAVLNESFVTHWKNVAFTDLQGISDSVKNIEHVARYANKMTLLGEEIEYNNLVDKLVTTAAATGTGRFKKSASVADDLSWVEKKGRWAMAQMTKIPFMMSWMDGVERVGTWFNTMSQPFTDAYNDELEMFAEVGKPVIDMIANRSKEDMKRHNTTFFIPEIKGTSGGTHTGNLKGHEIIAVALNVGNQGNLRKLLLGEGWADENNDADINLENTKLQAVLSHLTESDWQMVQKIWDQIDILYPRLAEVHRRTTGLVPPKVEATPVETKFGTFKGGYYPVKYDPTRDDKAAEFEARSEAEVGSMFASNASIQSSVNTGSTNERTGYFAPIHLTLSVVPNHIQETIHFITHHDAVRDVNRLLRDSRIKKAVTEKLGPEEFAQLKPWLNDIAKDGRNAPNKSIVDAIFNKLRLGTTLGVMGFKASTGIIQISGLSNTIAEVGMGPVMESMRTILGSQESMQSAWEFAIEKSKVLKHRTQTMDREIMNAMQQIESKRGVLAAVQEASMKHIALIQTYMVDLPSWHAAYIKELGESGDETKAFQYADWVIENVQGSGATKDMAALMRNQTKTHTIFTMFMTFFSSLWNMERDLIKGAKAGKYSTTTVAAKAMFLFTLPVLFEMMMRGEFSTDDDDEEVLLQTMLTKVALYPIMSIPFVRDIVNGVVGGYGYNASPVTSVIEQGLQGMQGLSKVVLADGELTKAQVKSVSKLAGVTVGLPGTGQAWATGEHLYDVIAEGEEFTTHQFLFGPKRK